MNIELRPLAVSDAATFASWATDPVFCAHAGWNPRPTPGEEQAWWRERVHVDDPYLTRLMAVSEGDSVGYVDLYGEGDSERELGFLVAPSSRWSRGFGSAVAAAGLTHGFVEIGLSQIWAEALELNAPSVRILRQLGMRETGRGGTALFLGEPSTYLQFAVTCREWVAQGK